MRTRGTREEGSHVNIRVLQVVFAHPQPPGILSGEVFEDSLQDFSRASCDRLPLCYFVAA